MTVRVDTSASQPHAAAMGRTGQIASIQFLRGVAALSIVVLHALNDVDRIAARAGDSVATSAAFLGAGVDLFFVISGFVMVVASRRLFAQPQARRLFLGRRIARIAPIYWAVTSAFLLVLAARPEAVNSQAPTLVEIAKSYLFIPYYKEADGWMQPVYSLGWTLNYEMFFYLLFAVALILPAARAVASLSAFMLGLVCLGLWLKPAPGALAFWTHPILLEFVAGMWIGLAHARGLRIGPLLAGTLLAAAFAILIATRSNILLAYGIQRLLCWGAPAALIVAAAALLPMPRLDIAPATEPFARIGDASYSLYLCHPFVLRGLAMVWEKLGLAFGPWAYAPAATLLATLAALVIHALFEKPVTERMQLLLGVSKRA